MSLIDTFDSPSSVLDVPQFFNSLDFDTLENDIEALKTNKDYNIMIKDIPNDENCKSYSYSSSKHYEMKNGKVKRNEVNEELNLKNNGKHYVVKRRKNNK